jgi:hypothetical protein
MFACGLQESTFLPWFEIFYLTVNMTLKLNLTVKNNLQIFGFFQLKSLGRAENSICSSGVNDFYPQCFVEPSGYKLHLG